MCKQNGYLENRLTNLPLRSQHHGATLSLRVLQLLRPIVMVGSMASHSSPAPFSSWGTLSRSGDSAFCNSLLAVWRLSLHWHLSVPGVPRRGEVCLPFFALTAVWHHSSHRNLAAPGIRWHGHARYVLFACPAVWFRTLHRRLSVPGAPCRGQALLFSYTSSSTVRHHLGHRRLAVPGVRCHGQALPLSINSLPAAVWLRSLQRHLSVPGVLCRGEACLPLFALTAVWHHSSHRHLAAPGVRWYVHVRCEVFAHPAIRLHTLHRHLSVLGGLCNSMRLMQFSMFPKVSVAHL